MQYKDIQFCLHHFIAPAFYPLVTMFSHSLTFSKR